MKSFICWYMEKVFPVLLHSGAPYGLCLLIAAILFVQGYYVAGAIAIAFAVVVYLTMPACMSDNPLDRRPSEGKEGR